MPDLSEKTTLEILNDYKTYLQGLVVPVSTEEIDELLEERLVPETDPVESMRGGIRPTRPSL